MVSNHTFESVGWSMRQEFAHWGPMLNHPHLKSLASEGYTWFLWGSWWWARTCCSHTCCPPPPWRDCCWESAGSQRTCQSQHRQPETRMRKEEGRGRKRGVRVALASGQGAWVWCKFPCVSEDLCYECLYSPLAEGRCSEETPLDACQEDDWSHHKLSVNEQRQTYTSRYRYEVCTNTSLTHSIPSASFSFVFFFYPIQGKHQWSVAKYKIHQRETNGNHTFVLIAFHDCV